MKARRVLRLTCCCCGDLAPAFEHWPNRDRGFGLCGKCAVWIKTRPRTVEPNPTDDEFRRCYGEEGRHWFAVSAMATTDK